jgi:transketolase
MTEQNLDMLSINTIKLLSVDSVQKANSGHPGAPMGAATMAYVLWKDFLKHNPENPQWINRDRFILSPGHASALLYSLLHLTGYEVSLEDLQQFRQLESKTPGHPEYGVTPGVEVTTGPLGQGFANGVGMAIAEAKLASDFNTEEHQIIDHYTYAIVSDGDLQEGVASEAASLAGTLKLNKLIYLYDSNNISIEGDTKLSFTENVAGRFKAYDWQVIGPVNGSDINEIHNAISQARNETSKPSLIICETVIGDGSPNKSGKASAHGEPLGTEEVTLTKQQLGWEYDDPFTVPEPVKHHFTKITDKGKEAEILWNKLFESYAKQYPSMHNQLNDQLGARFLNFSGEDLYSEVFVKGFGLKSPPADPSLDAVPVNMATREASGHVLNYIAPKMPGLIGGSADLAPSTKTTLNGFDDFNSDNRSGRNFHFGVREHAMGSIANGIALHGGFIPFTSTFLVFSDYMKPSIRLAALMNQQVIFVFTHDSIGVGEDGPTHQPIEHLLALRSIPNLTVIRPADCMETVVAWEYALQRKDGPTALILSRQSVPNIDRGPRNLVRSFENGNMIYYLSSDEFGAWPRFWEKRLGHQYVQIIATGSEVHLASEVKKILVSQKIDCDVFSLLSWEITEDSQKRINSGVMFWESGGGEVDLRVSIEAGSTLGWQKWVGENGLTIGIDTFGASAPGQELFTHFGLNAEHISRLIISKLDSLRGIS